MSLVSEQSIFCADIGRLISYAHGCGWAMTFGEAYRPQEMQDLYFKQGKTKTLKSAHIDKLAVDFNFFKLVDGKPVLTYEKKDLQQFGDYWTTLDKKNVWGGNWSSLVDTPHFERKVT